MDFAVNVKGVDESGQARWVLAVSETKLLVSNQDGTLHWVPLEDCRLLRVHTPEQPLLVIPVQPQPTANQLTIPPVALPNRAMRRNGNGV